MEKSKSQQLLILALLSADIAVMGDKVIYPIVANLYSAFPDQTGWVNYIVSGPLFIIFLISLLTSKLFPYFSKKKILVFSGVLFAVTSIFGCAIENVVYISIMRTLYGASIAMINVTAVAFIAEISSTNEERNRITSVFNGGLAVIGTVASLCAGILGAASWKGVFRYYYISILMVALFVLLLPETNQKTETVTAAVNKQKSKTYSPQFWICMATVTVIALCFNIIAMFVSAYIAENGLGGTSESSIASALVTVGSMAVSFCFTQLYKRWKKNTILLSNLLLIIAFLVLHFAASLILTYISMFAVGAAYMCALNFSYSQGAALAPDRIDDAIGMATALFAVAGFLSTYIVTGLMEIMGTQNIKTIILVPLALLIVLVLFYPIITKGNKRAPENE